MRPDVYVIAVCFAHSFVQWLKTGNLCCINLLLDTSQPAVKANVEKILSDQSMGDLAKWKAMPQYLLEKNPLQDAVETRCTPSSPSEQGRYGVASFQHACSGPKGFAVWM